MSLQSKIHLLGTAAAALFMGTASAQELLVHLPLDGSIENVGSGGDSELVGPPPVAVQGQVGHAMKFDGRSVIAVPVDLSSAERPRITITAWVRADETAPNSDHTVVSSGTQGTTPALRVAKRRSGVKASLRGGRAALLAGGYSPTEEWVFMAGTIDVPAQALHVLQGDSAYRRDGIRTNSLYGASKHANPNDGDADRQAWVFIGAQTFDTSRTPTVGIAIDDVRVYSGVLSDADLASIKDGSAGQAVAGAIEPLDVPEGMGAGAGDHEQPTLTGGIDGRHQLPDQEEIADRATEVARREALARAREREEAAGSSGDDGMTLEQLNEQLAAQNAEQMTGIDHESPTDALARDRAAGINGADVRGTANEPAEPERRSGPISALGQMHVKDYLSQIDFSGPATGNVRDCTSFAEVVRDVATEFRDKVIDFATTSACGFATQPVRFAQSALGLDDAGKYQTNTFRQALLEETYRVCVAGTAMASRLPDAMTRFWNARIANNSWASIGPRELELGRTQSGTLVAPGDRKFMTASLVHPQNNNAFLSLRERSGKARVSARVCAVTPFNHYRRLVAFSVNETPEERQNQSQYVGYDLNRISMQFLIVHLDGAGVVGRRFEYDLMVQ